MTGSAPLDLVTTAVLELLRGTGRPVFDAAYDGDPITPVFPYGVLYRLPGGSSDATPDLDDTRQTIVVPYQVTAVSNLRNQCEHTGSQLRDRLLARSPTGFTHPLAMPTGWACTDRRPDDALPGVDQSGSPPNVVYSQPSRFYLTISPA